MPQSIRQFKAGHLYEICFRARRGLPFVVTRYMELLIEAILARTQRDFKLTLCLYIFVGSHPHIVAIFKDAEQAKKFYMELEKKLTDAIKRLLGVEQLNIWAGTPRVIEIGELASAIKMIGYYYANPAAANLADTIEAYPGVSTWRAFVANKDKLEARVAKTLPWIRLWRIPKLPRRAVSEVQDKHITQQLIDGNKSEMHTLEVYPNIWMKCFGIERDEEVAYVNEAIMARIRHNEDVARRWRKRRGRKVIGAKALREQPLMAAHEPKKQGRRIFCIAATKTLRMAMIEEFKAFCAECRRCYLAWRDGNVLTQWPPGAFLPPLPPRANALC